jgi:RHS repeat-associated protein
MKTHCVTAEIYGTTGIVARRTGSGEFEPSDDDDQTTGHVMYNFSDVHPDNPTPGTVVKSYVWDEENRMKEAMVGREHVYFGYDAGGERTVKWSEHGETVYLDRMYQVETSTHPALYTKHIFVGDTRLISRIGDEGGSYGGQDAEMYYYHADHLGSSNWVTDNQGAEYEHLEYSPYGESWVEEGRDSLNRIDHLFTGKELDDETGLYYFGARYLDPKTSRWMSSDPAMEKYLPEAGKGADGLPGMGGVFNVVNLSSYPYAGNNPLKLKDPNGAFLHIVVDRATQIMTVTYTTPQNPTPQTYKMQIITAVKDDGDKNALDATGYQHSPPTQTVDHTHPRQIPGGTFQITGTGDLTQPSGDQTRYGGTDQSLTTSASQSLKIYNTATNQPNGRTVIDRGYWIHITPLEYTNGCIGIPYLVGNKASKSAALARMLNLINLYNQNKVENGGDGDIAVTVNDRTSPAPTLGSPPPTPQPN